MASENTVTIVGNVGNKPTLRETKSGTSKTFFNVAVQRPQSAEDRKSGVEAETDWFAVQAFGSLAENLVESLGKGSRVIVTGRLNTYVKTVEDDGEEKDLTVVQITADAAGPDLRWATAEIERNAKKSRSRVSGDDDLDDDDEDPKPKTRSRKAKDDDFDDEDEPKRKTRSRKAAADDDDDF